MRKMKMLYLKYGYVLMLNLYPREILMFLMVLNKRILRLLLIDGLDLLDSLDPMDSRYARGLD